MEVSRRNRHVNGGSSRVESLNLRAILAVAGEHVRLQRDPRLLRDVEKEVTKLAIGDHRVIEQKNSRAAAKPLLRLRWSNRGVIGGDAGLDRDANVGLCLVDRRLCPSQPDLFLRRRHPDNLAW